MIVSEASHPREQWAICLTFVGDIMFGRDIGRRLTNSAEPVLSAKVRSLLADSDLTIGNLESPVTESAGARLGLGASPLCADQLGEFDVLSLANNHMYDCGDVGIADTMALLDRRGVRHVGVSHGEAAGINSVVVDVRGTRCGFVATTESDLLQGKDQQSRFVLTDISDPKVDHCVAQLRRECDFVTLLHHGGNEYIPYPPPSLRERIDELGEAGLQLAITHHPHVLGGQECLPSGTLAWYSLGDFVFDSGVDLRRRGGILSVTVSDSRAVSVDFIPTWASDDYVVDLAPPRQSRATNRSIARVSRRLRADHYRVPYSMLYVASLAGFQLNRLWSVGRSEGIRAMLRAGLSRAGRLRFYGRRLAGGQHK